MSGWESGDAGGDGSADALADEPGWFSAPHAASETARKSAATDVAAP